MPARASDVTRPPVLANGMWQVLISDPVSPERQGPHQCSWTLSHREVLRAVQTTGFLSCATPIVGTPVVPRSLCLVCESYGTVLGEAVRYLLETATERLPGGTG